MRIIFKYLITIVFLIGQFIDQSQGFKPEPEEEQYIPVFEPFPSAIIDPLLLCQGGLTSSITVFRQNNKDYVAISLQICGIFIYDISNLENPILSFRDPLNYGKTLGVSFSFDDKLIWASNSKGEFYGIDVSKEPFQIKIQGTSKGNLLINQITPWFINQSILFILCNQEFQIFDWRQKNLDPVYMQSVNVNGISSKKILFVKQNQFALVTVPNKGVQFYIVQNGNDIEKMTFTYSCVLKPNFFDVKDFAYIDDQTIAVVMYLQGIFLYNLQNYFADNGNSCTSTSFIQLAISNLQGNAGNLCLTKNSRYLLGQFRVVGVKIFDVSKQTLQIVQEISVENNSKDITLNENEDLLFYSNSLSVQVFKKTVPNFNRDIPNLLLNTYQAVKYNFFMEDPSMGSIMYQCIWKSNEQQVILTRANVGVTILKYSGNGILESNSSIYSQNSLTATTDVQFLQDGVTAYLVRQGAGLSIIDFSDPSKPIILKENLTLGAGFTFNIFLIFYDNYTKGLLSNTINVLIISIVDPLNPFILGVIDTLKFTLGEVSANRLAVTKAGNLAFIGVSQFGVVVADISNPSSPKPLYKFFTDGVSEIKLTQDDKYCIIGANYQGLFITKVNPNGELTLVSKIQLQGTVLRIILIKNDQYVLVASFENPSISIVSIADITNPIQLQRLGNKQEISYIFFCPSIDETQIFVVGLLHLSLFTISSQIIIHTQIYELINQENSSDYYRKMVQKGVPLKIGQTIEMHLVPIYQERKVSIKKVFYYELFTLQELPAWMTFYPNDLILKLDITKNSLKKNKQGQYFDTIQQVVFLTYQSIKNNTFINVYLDITFNDSLQIYKACIAKGLINQDGFIKKAYDHVTPINFGNEESTLLQKWTDSQLNLVKNFIQYTLNQNIINYTIQFQIENSLIVDLSKTSEIIKSIQKSIDLQMTVYQKLSEDSYVQSNVLKFVEKAYSSVLILLSDKQDEIKLSGSLKNINKVLQDGIKYSLNDKSILQDDIYIQLIISDGVNYNYVQKSQYQQFKFLIKQSQIVLSQTNSMQKEINSKYNNGKLYIQETFSYQIGSDIFTSADENQLKYTAQLKEGNIFREIPKSFWLQFSSADRSFSGIPLASNFNDEVTIQVNATDGYNYQVDTFTITPNQVPFSYIIQISIQILGPLFGLIGLYKYRSFIYNISFKENYTYSRDIIYVGEEYKKQIVVTDNIKPVANKLWKFFLQQIGEKEIKDQLFLEILRYRLFKSQILKTSKIQKDQFLDNSNYKNQFNLEIIRKKYKFEINMKDYSNILNNQSQYKSYRQKIPQNGEQKCIQTLINTQQNSSVLNNPIDKPQSQNTDNLLLFDKWINETKHSLIVGDRDKRLKSLTKSIQDSIIINKKQISIKEDTIKKCSLAIFNSKREINKEKILQFIKEKQLNNLEKKRILSQLELNQLNNVNSAISVAIYCFLVEYLLNLDKTSKYVYQALHLLACRHYKEIDWYKAYVNIEPSFQEVNQKPYPRLTICRKSLDSALSEINNCIYTAENQGKDYSIYLIEENLKARAIGYSHKSLSFLQATEGESLHTYRHMIHSIQAFEKNSSITCCFKLYKNLNLDFKQMSLIENNKLPSWIKSVDLINGAILFGGIPEQKDIGIIVIKIIDQDKYILRSYEIQILQRHSDILDQKDREQENSQQTDSLKAQDITFQGQEDKINSKQKSVKKQQKFSPSFPLDSQKLNCNMELLRLNKMIHSSNRTQDDQKLLQSNQITQLPQTLQTYEDEMLINSPENSQTQRKLLSQLVKNNKKVSKQVENNNERIEVSFIQDQGFNLTERNQKIRVKNNYVSKPCQEDDNVQSDTD